MLLSYNLTTTLQNYVPENIYNGINCKYYNENSILQTYTQNKLHFSIRSINKHRTEFQAFLDTININFDVLALTELGNTNVESSAAFFENYQLYYNPATTNFGEAGFLLHNDVKVLSERDDLILPKILLKTLITW